MVIEVRDVVAELFGLSKDWQGKYFAYMQRDGAEVRTDIMPYAMNGHYILEDKRTGERQTAEYNRERHFTRLY